MNLKDPKMVVLAFNECINSCNIEGLAALMAEDCVFIDSGGGILSGKGKNLKGWLDFFAMFPDYRNHFSILESRGNEVMVIGHSTCSDERLNGPSLWKAVVENDLIAEWRVLSDTPDERKKLDLPAGK